MSDVESWVTPAAGNLKVPPDGYPENMDKSGINDSSREVMAAVLRFYQNAEWLDLSRDPATGDPLTVQKQSANVVRIVGADLTAFYTSPRRVRMTGGAPDPVYAHVVSSVLTGSDTDITVSLYEGHSEVPPGMTAIRAHIAGSVASGGFATTTTVPYLVPLGTDAAAINSAIVALAAGGVGIVWLNEDTYTIDATITMAAGITLQGQGADRTKLNVAANVHAITIPSLVDNVLIRDLTIDGDSASRSGPDFDGIHMPGHSVDVRVRDCAIFDVARDGIHSTYLTAVDPPERHFLSGLRIDTVGRDGIRYEDTDSLATKGPEISDCVIQSVGQDATVNIARGIYIEGIAHISNVAVRNLDANSPDVPRGIEFGVKVGAEPIDKAGRRSGVTGCVIRGVGDSALGIVLGGHQVTVAGCSVHLNGVNARAYLIDGTSGALPADENVITGCVADEAGTGVLLTVDAYRNRVIGCVLTDCGVGIDNLGVDNAIQGNTIHNPTNQGIDSTGAEAAIVGNHVVDSGDDSIRVNAGGDKTAVSGNVVRGSGVKGIEINADTCHIIANSVQDSVGVGIEIAAAANAAKLDANILDGNSSDDVLNNGTAMANFGRPRRRHGLNPQFVKTSGETTEVIITNWNNIPLDTIDGNGTRLFRISVAAYVTTTLGTSQLTLRLRMGPLGTIGDPVVLTFATIASTTPGVSYQLGPHEIFLTPAAGDKMTMTAQRGSIHDYIVNDDVLGGDQTYLLYEFICDQDYT
jgi:hypothetical protein